MDEFPDIPGYKIEGKLSQEPFADVYLAVKEEIGQKVVIKVLIPDLAEDKEFTERFLYEARRAAKLDHPNIVKILDIGEAPDLYYFVMEYFQDSLRNKIIDRQLSTDMIMDTSGDTVGSSVMEGVDPYEVVDVFRQLFDALNYACEEEAFHGCLRPENIFLKEDHTPVIVDFFISRILDTPNLLEKKRANKDFVLYTAPEQILKKPIDISSDIYSLGIILYEMLTGEIPFDAKNIAAIEEQHIKKSIPQLPEYFNAFQPLINRMMAKDKEERAQSGAELNLLMDELIEQLLGEENKVEEQSEEEEAEQLQQAEEKEVEQFQQEEEKKVGLGPLLEQEIGMESEEKPGLAQDSPQEKDFTFKQVEDLGRVNQLLTKFQNPRLLIPAAAAIVIIVLIVIFFSSSGSDSETKENTVPKKVLSAEEKQEIEIRYTRVFRAAQSALKAGKNEEALKRLTQAGQIKASKEVEILMKKLETKIAVEKDNKAFQKSSKINTKASYEEYLSKYSSGRHAEKAQKKIKELIELEKKRKAEKKKWAASRVKLRSTYRMMTASEIKSRIIKLGFFEKYYNKTGNFRNYFEVQTINKHKIILDYATGLIWHQAGSPDQMDYQSTLLWIKELNQQKYAGYSDWRLPTLEEALSLLERSESKYYLYIDSLFAPKQKHIWTGDKSEKNKVWALDFYSGDVNQVPFDSESYVRPLRSEK